MTTYPLEFHRRSEQKWALRAPASGARESTPRAARVGTPVGHGRHGQGGSGPPERRDIVDRSHGCGKLGNASAPGTMRSTTPSRNVSPRC
jgi:hypothetical protein